MVDVGGCSYVVNVGGRSYVVNVGGCSYVVNVGGRSCVVNVGGRSCVVVVALNSLQMKSSVKPSNSGRVSPRTGLGLHRFPSLRMTGTLQIHRRSTPHCS